jgi:hypothetical protein
MARTYITKEVTFELDLDDVLEFIEDCSKYDLDRIKSEIADSLEDSSNIHHSLNDIDGSYIKSEKDLLLSRAANRYTLEELEARLGTKWDLL